ncbi:vesicle transport through interaction with t-SNAREs 1 [Plasmodium inui San Antonio 1]|uniref:Vesicle transport through interaction with t-SNAREs 1 n=1 Tax=Plasmodium inui San Antonio 1 TaxID=1237626 RepID=W6ZXW4_9APIC|nr:vesicle transport through interaction with t-SNAREs 1 [Plasmodium inui San Antonio 1]EUD65632.1 vesicle transport through interaction with t-SNAREs 1 [Plasmodium inui San Antonio 1]
MITYSEYFDEYVKDLDKYIHKIKSSIHQIQNLEGIQKTKEDIFEAEKCIKQIIVETNSLPKGSHKIFDDIRKHQEDVQKYKKLLNKMSSDYYSDEVLNKREYDTTRKYMEGTNFLKESERRAQDVEDMGYTIMSELTAQRSAILRTKLYTDETMQEQSRVKRMLLSIYHNKVLFKCLLILIIILLAIANIGVIIYKIK